MDCVHTEGEGPMEDKTVCVGVCDRCQVSQV